ncbi:hypothetical protein [Xanthomonas translucens]|uniref:hypothetical protein n=1 Tax=Xanthomonas campestris pv. translucens TaxID=343 RepID=UPI0002ECEC62|nr:hypothetical protein [Xanthomonas translucens]MCC8445195.1 hypothetical protein [Xanthomonas translucens pv. translucens]
MCEQRGTSLHAKPRRAIRKQNKINWDYQLYIANLKVGPEQFCCCDKETGTALSKFDFSLAGRALTALKGEPQPDVERLNVKEWLYNGVCDPHRPGASL